ncbi:substrate-binding domain-containing protein [Kineosporia sp. R_H_3]|uniref:substrate-binding domain-containing protein n=1 Tax=Kineosporia sp. R_H_3 TaxID=1961848 RepID=UPI000B4BF2BE|nr:substrate-binding domain-containing protein [Kineosporia sp. R_H_3]
MRPTRLRLVAFLAVAAASLAACGGGSSAGAGSSSSAAAPSESASTPAATAGAVKEGLKIAILPKAINIPYFDAAYAGAQKACAEIKAECEQIGPTQATGAAQLQFINTVIQKKYDALVISAADANSVVPALKKAQDAGVAVVTYDADVADTSARSVMVKPTTPDLIGKSQVDWISKAIGSGGGEIAILSAAATAENQNAWIKIMEAELAANHPELKLVDTVYGDDDAAKSAEKAAALMQSHPNLKGIISPTTVGVAAAAKYISGSKYKGTVQVTGLGLPSEMKAYVKDGTVKSFGLWDPGMLGYLGVYAAGVKASGGDPKAGFKAGDKDYTVDGDGVAIVGPPQEFTAENVDQFTF